jgi:hypothetical protein
MQWLKTSMRDSCKFSVILCSTKKCDQHSVRIQGGRIPSTIISEDKGPSDTIPVSWRTSTFHVAVQDFLDQKVPKKLIGRGSPVTSPLVT